MTSVHDLSDDELRAELERTRDAYAEYVRDVGEHPTHSTRDLDDDVRRRAEAVEPEALGIAGQAQRAVPDHPRAETLRNHQVVGRVG